MWWAIGYAALSVGWGFAVLWHWEYAKAMRGANDETDHLFAGVMGCLIAPLAIVAAMVVVVARITSRIPRAMAMRALEREKRWRELQAISAEVDREMGMRGQEERANGD